MGKPEIVEISKFWSDDELREAVVTFGETEDEWYKVNMYDKKNNSYYWLYVKTLEQGIVKAEDFVRNDCAV